MVWLNHVRYYTKWFVAHFLAVFQAHSVILKRQQSLLFSFCHVPIVAQVDESTMKRKMDSLYSGGVDTTVFTISTLHLAMEMYLGVI
jgi:hypothetical protein